MSADTYTADQMTAVHEVLADIANGLGRLAEAAAEGMGGHVDLDQADDPQSYIHGYAAGYADGLDCIRQSIQKTLLKVAA